VRVSIHAHMNLIIGSGGNPGSGDPYAIFSGLKRRSKTCAGAKGGLSLSIFNLRAITA
jgi:hypothetical protein